MPYCEKCKGEGGRESRLPGKAWIDCKACSGRGTDTPGVLSSKVLIRMGEAAERERRELLDRERAERRASAPPKPNVRDNMVHLAEERAARAGDAAKWTVRDALQHALRKLDAGELEADWCCLVFKKNPTTETAFKPDYVRAGHADPDNIVGTLVNVANRIAGQSDDD